MLRLLKCEYVKLKRSGLLLIGILGTLIVPMFVYVKAITACFLNPGTAMSLFSLYDDAFMFLMRLFAPMVLTVLHAWIISREYTDGTLKNLLTIPVSKTTFLWGKLLFLAVLTFLFMLISWLEILGLAFLCSFFVPVTELTVPSALFFLARMLFGGCFLCATQSPFIYLTIRSRGSVIPLITIAAVSLVNVVLSNSPIAGFYPWSASYLLASGRLSVQYGSKGVSMAIILAMCLVGIVASLLRFGKQEVK